MWLVVEKLYLVKGVVACALTDLRSGCLSPPLSVTDSLIFKLCPNLTVSLVNLAAIGPHQAK